MSRSSKEECEDLMTEMVDFAFQMLNKNEVLCPFGRTLLIDGKVTFAMGLGENEDNLSVEGIELMNGEFKRRAQEGSIKACGVSYDARVKAPDTGEKFDAVVVCLDHKDNYSVEVYFPYKIDDQGNLSHGETFAYIGKNQIFS